MHCINSGAVKTSGSTYLSLTQDTCLHLNLGAGCLGVAPPRLPRFPSVLL